VDYCNTLSLRRCLGSRDCALGNVVGLSGREKRLDLRRFNLEIAFGFGARYHSQFDNS
jgi:hypothetical protein